MSIAIYDLSFLVHYRETSLEGVHSMLSVHELIEYLYMLVYTTHFNLLYTQ